MSSIKILLTGAIALLIVALVVVTLSGHRVWRQGEGGPREVQATERVGDREQGITQLMRSSLNGDESAVRSLLDRGADVNARDNDGETALMAASFSGHVGVVKLLLDRGAEVNGRSRTGWTALNLAVKRSNDEVRRLLLANGALR